jgi:hypothetical protein
MAFPSVRKRRKQVGESGEFSQLAQISSISSFSQRAKLHFSLFVAAAAALTEMRFCHPVERENPNFIGRKASFVAAQRQSVPCVGEFGKGCKYAPLEAGSPPATKRF